MNKLLTYLLTYWIVCSCSSFKGADTPIKLTIHYLWSKIPPNTKGIFVCLACLMQLTCGHSMSRILVHFKTIQDFSWVVLSSPVPFQIFPKFFGNFPEQQYHTFVVSSRSRLFGKWHPVSSGLVSKKKLGNADL